VSSFAVGLCLQLDWAPMFWEVWRVSSLAVDLCLQLGQVPNVLGSLESELTCC
jgi:hypothetical protein